jgi:hypothetical protein
VRINNLGYVKSHSIFVNNLDCLERLRQRYDIQLSLGKRDEIQKLTAEANKLATKEKEKLSPLLLATIEIFKAKEFTRNGFTKDSIKAILLTVFGISPSNSGPTSNKADRLKLLEQLDTDNPFYDQCARS